MKTLLHICCGPCACYSVDALRNEGYSLTGYWFNPNIHPWTEYQKRLSTAKEYADKVALPMMIRDEYPLESWLAAVASDPDNRCRHCYSVRLYATAKAASENDFKTFSTTLLYSKYQKHEWIIQEAEKAAEKFGVPFLYRDLREGWQKGIDLSKKYSLYRQQYCGCIYSEKERYLSG